MNIVIKNITFAELYSDNSFNNLVKEYAEEATVAEMPQKSVDIEAYLQLEKDGVLYTMGAYNNYTLIGFMAVITKVLPHNGTQITFSDAIYVDKEHRKTGVGSKLITNAETYAESIGSYGVVIGAPIGGSFIDALQHIGYAPTNVLFFKRLK